MNVVRLSVIRAGRLYSPGNIADISFHLVAELTRVQCSTDTIGNRTREVATLIFKGVMSSYAIRKLCIRRLYWYQQINNRIFNVYSCGRTSLYLVRFYLTS
jgi:hypothetical protein